MAVCKSLLAPKIAEASRCLDWFITKLASTSFFSEGGGGVLDTCLSIRMPPKVWNPDPVLHKENLLNRINLATLLVGQIHSILGLSSYRTKHWVAMELEDTDNPVSTILSWKLSDIDWWQSEDWQTSAILPCWILIKPHLTMASCMQLYPQFRTALDPI